VRGPVSSRWLATIRSISPTSCVADAFEVGDDVRREDDRQLAFRDDLHHRLHELAACKRIERGDGLIEQ
jgi:hypothetical protein